MSRARVLGGFVVLGLLASACAGLHASPSAGSGGTNPLAPKTVTVSTQGQQAVLHLGDTLVFRPTLELMPPGLRWKVVELPPQLKLTSKPGAWPFQFTAVHSGIGTLQAIVYDQTLGQTLLTQSCVIAPGTTWQFCGPFAFTAPLSD